MVKIERGIQVQLKGIKQILNVTYEDLLDCFTNTLTEYSKKKVGSTLSLIILQAKNTTGFSEDAIMKWKTRRKGIHNMTEKLIQNSADGVKKIYSWEPGFFMFFGVFHLHRIWALVDRESYASFWMGIMESKGIAYFGIMGILASLCVLGIVAFIKNRKLNYWWRWIYIFGGSYVLFDLFSIATGMKFWSKVLEMMFDTNSPYWNIIWTFFIALGGFVFVLGIRLLRGMKVKDN